MLGISAPAGAVIRLSNVFPRLRKFNGGICDQCDIQDGNNLFVLRNIGVSATGLSIALSSGGPDSYPLAWTPSNGSFGYSGSPAWESAIGQLFVGNAYYWSLYFIPGVGLYGESTVGGLNFTIRLIVRCKCIVHSRTHRHLQRHIRRSL